MEKEVTPDVCRCPPPSKFRKRLTLALLKLRKLPGLSFSRREGLRITPLFVIKYGSMYQQSEADAIHLVQTRTSVPVPKIYAAFTKDDRMYMLMRREKGKQLYYAWQDLDEEKRKALLIELRQAWRELRALESPYGEQVCSVNNGKLNDVRLQVGGHGPYTAIEDFHKALGTTYVLRDALDGKSAEAIDLAREMKTKQWTTRLTHGDLSSFNILVRKDGTLSCILDWEMSGWLPEYYEYASSWHGNLYDEHFLRPLLHDILDQYPQELKMDTMRRECYVRY